MNQIAVAPEVLQRFHELAAATQRSDAEVIGEALTSYLAADRRYVVTLTERIAAADKGDFASDEVVEHFFAEHSA
jgi:predicted transcriptional regulator